MGTGHAAKGYREMRVSEIVEATPTPSVALCRRAAERAASRMLIDGELVAAATGAKFDNVSPATGSVLGSTAAAGPDDMSRAIGAARRAFDETDWSTNGPLRKRCLVQLQAAIETERDHLREELIAEVGCPDMTIGTAQLDWPLAESLRYPARLIDDFEWERLLDGGGLFGDRNVRTVVKEPVGRSGMGAYHGKAGFDTFSHRRSVVGSDLPFSVTGSAAPPFSRPMKLYADLSLRLARRRTNKRLKAPGAG
jgi:hypothetical protein